MTHNEGYAVYAPLYLRQKYGHMGEFSHPILKDYEVLVNKSSIKNLINQYNDFVKKLYENQKMTLEDYLDEAFGTKRYPYRIGCTLVNSIEEKYGISEVQKAIYLSGSDFIKKYEHLLSSYRFDGGIKEGLV